ncbi:hypothetical protein N7507_001967 [Penicillium longicatenatum]|nr:hypothetical protein N7507_001967 [Penicillium longicatenatum]
MLSAEEWRQIDYLLFLTQPFFKFTTLLSKTKDVSIHLVFSIYNKLFDHLEKAKSALRRKKVAWKQLMLLSLEAAEKKLSHYYGITDEIDNNLYAISTILSPQQKLDFFKGKDWDDPDVNYRTKYRKSLEDYFRPYKQRLSETHEYDEIKEYLNSAIVRTPRDHQHQFPALANLARDILSIPATGAGVERLFNSARDICHYRRGSLKSSTIQDLMMFMFTSRFEIEDSHRALINEYLSSEERQASQEEKDTTTQPFEPISDNEEDDDSGDGDGDGDGDGAQPLQSQRALIEDEANGEPSLPSQRSSGRVRQRSTLLNGYETEGWKRRKTSS